MKKKHIHKISLSSVFTALIFVATYFIAIPMPAFGYINLGDAFVLLAAWILGPISAICAGIGAALSDLLLGYVIYAPATLIIKAIMAIACFYLFRLFSKLLNNPLGFVISALCSELIMVAGYFLFEGFLYGFGASVINIPFNLIQGAFAIAVSNIIASILFTNKTIKKYISSIQ